MWEIIRVNFGIVSLIGKPVWIGNHYLEHGVEQLRPWAIAYIFYGVPGYSDVHAEYGVDNHFAFEGKRHHKELAGLETDDEHVQVLGGMNDAESESILVDAIYYRDKEKALGEQLLSAWKRGDLATVGQYLGREYLLNPTAEQKLLDVRNRKWIPQIKAEFNSGKATSIVVGAGHMLGPNGLVGLLKKEGFKFEQL